MEKRLIHLDFIRGFAAVVVMAGHLRVAWFVNYEQLPSHSWLDKAFYFVTGLGHQSVMIFFVLSGFFIAGSVSAAFDRDKWSWREYAINRLTRLWVVLLPALLVTLVVDQIGIGLTHGAGYDGRYRELINSGPSPAIPANFSIATFVGNMAFLQTIVTPVFGSNGPLWSLANEFWYYLLFPLLLQLFHPRSRLITRIIGGVISSLMMFLLPKGLMLSGIVWLFGYGAYVVTSTKSSFRICRTLPFFLVALVSLILFIGLARSGKLPLGDYLVGVAFAGMIPFLANLKSRFALYEQSAIHLSNVSYTLYVFHFPFVAFLFYCFLPKERMLPTMAHYLGYAACFLAVLGLSFPLWWLFESRTTEVKNVVRRILKLPSSRPQP